jgi:hypothetical protein
MPQSNCVADYKGTIIRLEVPEIYVWGLGSDYSWLSVNRKYAKRNGVRSFPNGLDDVETFVTHLGKVDQSKIEVLLRQKGQDPATYDLGKFWQEFGAKHEEFIHYESYKHPVCSQYLRQFQMG